MVWVRCVSSVHFTPPHFQDGPFPYTKEQQGIILGAFYYGYVVSQVPGGMLAERFGGKWVFVGFTIITTVGTLLTPVAAHLHLGALIAIRCLIGIGSVSGFRSLLSCL